MKEIFKKLKGNFMTWLTPQGKVNAPTRAEFDELKAELNKLKEMLTTKAKNGSRKTPSSSR